MKSLKILLIFALALPIAGYTETKNLKDSYFQQESLKDKKLSYCTNLAKKIQYTKPYTYYYIDNAKSVWYVRFLNLYPYGLNKFKCKFFKVGKIGEQYLYRYRDFAAKIYPSRSLDDSIVTRLFTYENDKLIEYYQNSKNKEISRTELATFDCDKIINRFLPDERSKIYKKNCFEFRSN